jgi:uncharacterized protein YndB with AHSA1/START domain
MTTALEAAIEREVELRASPDRVWRALTDPRELAAWFGCTAEFDLRPSGSGHLEWPEHGRFAMRVEAVEAERRFAFRWARDRDVSLDDGISTLVEFTLEPRPDGGTVLRVRETGFVRPEDRSDNVEGWFGGFWSLAAHLAMEPWEAGIHRTYDFRSPVERVFEAFASPDQFRAWFGGEEPVPFEPGAEGWFVWPEHGRYAVRVETVEPPRYLAWRWATTPDTPLDEAPEILRTEWLFARRADGGTSLQLFESGFRDAENHRLNHEGWDADVLPALRRVLGESG